MPVYITLREGPSPAESEPILVASDARLLDALIAELGKMAREPEQPGVLSPPAAPTPTRPRAPRRSSARALRALPAPKPAGEVDHGH